MAKIHGWVYIIVGLFILIASWRINYNSLYLFFYAGIFFIAFGIAKIILGLIFQKSKGNMAKNPQMAQQFQRSQYKRCNTCGNTARAADRFCSRCGNKLY